MSAPARPSNGKTGPLAGLRIVEFAGLGPAPFAAKHVGQLVRGD